MSNDRLEPFNYHNIAFKRCADVVSLERLDRLWFFRHHWFVKIGWFGKCWTDLLAFWGVWNRSGILNFGPDRLFFRFSRALLNRLGGFPTILYRETFFISFCVAPHQASRKFLHSKCLFYIKVLNIYAPQYAWIDLVCTWLILRVTS